MLVFSCRQQDKFPMLTRVAMDSYKCHPTWTSLSWIPSSEQIACASTALMSIKLHMKCILASSWFQCTVSTTCNHHTLNT
jgi:hypothetical protein